MTSTTAASWFPLSVPQPPSPLKISPLLPSENFLHSYRCSSLRLAVKHHKISSSRSDSSPATVAQEEEAEPTRTDLPPPTGCKACNREEVESGCNGEGRIQGGIATIPGFGWWPIKAYRPCPAYVASGGRYRRTGQNMDEVVSGGAAKKSR